MTHHDLKIWPEYMQPKLDGLKDWEHRGTRDRTFKPGDTATFLEFDLTAGGATGRTYGPVRITYVLKVDALHCIFSHTMPETNREKELFNALREEQAASTELRGRIVRLQSDVRILDRKMQALSERAFAAEEALRLRGTA
jgi:hypothetical protein